MTDSDFQLETHSVEVEVVLRDRRTLPGCVFLRPAAGKHLGAETLDDRLNEAHAFFPWLNAQSTFVPLFVGSHILYLHRDAIQTVRDHNPSITVPPASSEAPNTTRS